MADTQYFAYGSNMNTERKKKRTGPIRQARRARLAGYRLAFNKWSAEQGLAANLVPESRSYVWGVLYRCDDHAMREIDKAEGVNLEQYYRTMVTVALDSKIVRRVQQVPKAAGCRRQSD